MPGVAFFFPPPGMARPRLEFRWPVSAVAGVALGQRYAGSVPPPWTGIATRVGSRHAAPPVWSGIARSIGPRHARSGLASAVGVGTRVGERFAAPIPIILLPWTGIATRVGGRLVAPFRPFPGYLPPQNVRANGCGAGWRAALGQHKEARAGVRGARVRAGAAMAGAAVAGVAVAAGASPWRAAPLAAAKTDAPARAAHCVECDSAFPWSAAPLSAHTISSAWRPAAPASEAVALAFVRAFTRGAVLRAPGRFAPARARLFDARQSAARPAIRALRAALRAGRTQGGLSWPWSPRAPIPPAPGTEPRAALGFHFHAPIRMRQHFAFGASPARVTPIRGSYRMVHEIEFHRLPDQSPIDATQITISTAWDEWCWSFSANLMGPVAVQRLRAALFDEQAIEVLIDDYAWRFQIDSISAAREFGKASGQVQGRALSALLGPGKALAVNGMESETKTARQIAEQELAATDWQMDWALEDWTIPGKRYSYQRKTPIEIITDVVGAAGGRLSTDPTGAVLRAAPRYPVPPWRWAQTEPDRVLPMAIVQTLGWTPRVGQPWNGVYLGDGTLVLAHAKITGTPGSATPDAALVEPLLCDAAACRQRGIALLAEAWGGFDFEFAAPLTGPSGDCPLFVVGQMVAFTEGGADFFGIITGVRIAVGLAKVTQSIDVRAVLL